MLGTQDYRKELDRQFKSPKSNFKIAVVVDMWLTGFDVPFLDTLYIDKPIQHHNLIQTISRVNRKFEGKRKGLVVDYIGVKKQMNLALAHYNKADQQNIEEIEQSIILAKDHLVLLGKLFHKFDDRLYFQGSPVQQLSCLNLAAEYAQLTDKIEKIKLPNTKIKLLQQLLAKAIEDFKRVNKARGVDFSKQLQVQGIDLEVKAFYDILKDLAEGGTESGPHLAAGEAWLPTH